MTAPEQVKLPLVTPGAAKGADETVLPPMMPGEAWADTGTARAPSAVAQAATRTRRRTPDSFRAVPSKLIDRTVRGAAHAAKTPADPYLDVMGVPRRPRCPAQPGRASVCRHHPMGRSASSPG